MSVGEAAEVGPWVVTLVGRVLEDLKRRNIRARAADRRKEAEA